MLLTFDNFVQGCINYVIQHKLTVTVNINKFTNAYPNCYSESEYVFVKGKQVLIKDDNNNNTKDSVNKINIEQVPILGVLVETNIIQFKTWLDSTFKKSERFNTYDLIVEDE
jgi:hypothetical protein